MAMSFLHVDNEKLAFGFASDLLGSRWRVQGRTGRLVDLVVREGSPYPTIEGAIIKTGGKKHFVSQEKLTAAEQAGPRAFSLATDDLKDPGLDGEVFLLGEVLMDKQVVDTLGAKVERVNDVHLLYYRDKIHLVHVDVGFTGLLRRLGVEPAAARLSSLVGRKPKDEWISWRHIQPFHEKSGHGRIRLDVDVTRIKELHPGELADILEDLSKDERTAILSHVDAETAAGALEEIEPELGAQLVEQLDPAVAADIIEEMEPSLAADLIEEVDEEAEQEIKQAMDGESRREIEALQAFEKDTAGALMTTNYLSLAPEATVAEALRQIRAQSAEVEYVYYLYLVQPDGVLAGVVNLRQLILAEPQTELASLVGSRLVFVHPETDWQEVAEVFYKYNFPALPVVDREQRLMGIILYKHSFDELAGYYYRMAG